MKQFCLAVLLCLAATAGHAQVSTYGNITASGATCATTNACVSLGLYNTLNGSSGGVVLTVSANAGGNTLQFEGTGDGVTWSALSGYPLNSAAGVTSTTSTGQWLLRVTGLVAVRVRCSTYVSGTSVVNIQASTNSVGGLGGISPGSPLTATNIPQANSSGNLINSGCMSDGAGNETCTSVTASGAVTAGSIATSPSGGTGGGFVSPEGTAPSTIGGVTVPQAGYDAAYADSTTHAMLFSYNNGPWGYAPIVVGSDSSTFTVSAGTGLVGSPVTLLPTTLPTGLYRADYEIAQLSHGNCTTPGTISVRLGYTDGLTNASYLLSSSNTNVGYVEANLGNSLLNAIVLGTAINTGSAYVGSKIFYALNGVAVTYQPNQSVGASGGTCAVFDTFQVVIKITKI